MIRRPPRSTLDRSSAASDVYKRQLFLTLLDKDRFEGRYREGVHTVDTSDVMRRMVKEKLLPFEGKPLFPGRIAETVPYELPALDQGLYEQVTDYVRDGVNRADRVGGQPVSLSLGAQKEETRPLPDPLPGNGRSHPTPSEQP